MLLELLLAASLGFAAPAEVAAPTEPPAVAAQALGLTDDQVRLLRQALDQAPTQGLDLRPATAEIEPLLSSSDPALVSEGEKRLIAAAVRYAQAARRGLLAPDRFPSEWAQRPAPFDAATELAAALAGDRLGPWLAGLPPQGVEYAALQNGLERYRRIAADGGWAPLAKGAALGLGAEDDRVAALRARLLMEDADAPQDGGRLFDQPLVDALVAYQQRRGLEATGKLDARTLAELNLPVEHRLRQIEANLERRRWASARRPATRIEVNIADQSLAFYREGLLILSMRTIVGRPKDPTPSFADTVQSIVFNPPWNVPPTIAAKELWPKARRDPGYLARNDFIVLPNTGGQGLQQKAGPKSALGLVKFDLPNSFNVYLHDTPARSLFDRTGSARALSHGCVRLQQPIDLARELLRDDPAWGKAAIDAALASKVTTRVSLETPVAVYLNYWTAFPDGDGALNFRPDLYGWDAKLVALIAAQG